MKLKNITALCAFAALYGMADAQTAELTPINFEDDNLKAVGVYDTWADSPFRTGKLAGNVAIVDNFLADEEADATAKILGVQRSRLGSNTFGVRLDLNEPLATTTTERYLHVMMHKPVEGRVMLIGLGKRTDRAEQSADVEQFWTYPVSDVKTGEWFDAVFPVKTNNGVEIHSLVIVPHCEAPHTLTEDFVAYIDEIVYNDNLRPRVGADKYPVNFSKDADWGRDDRKLLSITMTGGTGTNPTLTLPTPRKAFNELFDQTFKAKPGDRVTPSVNYEGTWMHSYVYLDRDNDGEFSYSVNDDSTIGEGSDLMSYSAYRAGSTGNFRNSAGDVLYTSSNAHNTLRLPAFTVPADLAHGLYRVRYKIDWNNVDPGGCIASDNHIINNGGGICDALLNVHGDNVSVTNDNRNGEVTTADGTSLNNYTHPFGQPLSIKMVPSNGFDYNGIRVRHGYNLHGDSLVNGNPQYRDDVFFNDLFDADDCFTIPGEYIDGDVLIEGLFVEDGKARRRIELTYNVEVDGKIIATQTHHEFVGEPYPAPDPLDIEASEAYYSLSGLPTGLVSEEKTVVTLVLEQTLPFETSAGYDNANWYLLTLTGDFVYLRHNSSLNYISLASTATAKPTKTDLDAQWAFVGNVIDGFMIINRAAGDGKILSSSTNTSSNTGGSTYPVMTNYPVADTNNTYWIPTVSNDLSRENVFYLHQKGIPANRMNSRDSRLAYWTGGADGGSTFSCEKIDSTSAIDGISQDDAPARYYNLQGIEVSAYNLRPGIYVCRRGAEVSKIYVR